MLIKHRPSIELRAPLRIVPGIEATCQVLVTTKRPLPIEAITAEVKGEERADEGGEDGAVHRIRWANLHADLSGPRMLSEGVNELSFRFVIPEDAPGSFDFGSVAVEYQVKIHVDIDWWPDKISTFMLNVRRFSKVEPVPPNPRVYSTAPGGPEGGNPSLELSLSSDVVTKDGHIEFSVGAINLEKKTVRKLTATLVPRQTIKQAPGRTNSKSRITSAVLNTSSASSASTGLVTETRHLPGYVVRLPPENLNSGIVTRMKVPEVPASIKSLLFEFDYLLEVNCDISHGTDSKIRVPIAIREAGSVLDDHGNRPRPVGASRERKLWESLAAELSLEVDGFRMHSRVKEVQLEVRLGRPDEKARLVSELTFPSLHLGLDGGPREGLRRFFRKHSPVGSEAFLETHYVTGRDETQLIHWAEVLGDSLLNTSLGDLTDETVTLISVDRTQAALRQLCTQALEVALKLPDASNAIPPPELARAFHDRWQECAQRENARLENARMALHLDLGKDQGAVITKWDSEGKPSRTTVRLRVQNPINKDYRFETTGQDPLSLDGFRKEQRDLITWIQKDASYFSITGHEMQVYLPPMLKDPEPGMAILRRLMSLHWSLRGATSPYR